MNTPLCASAYENIANDSNGMGQIYSETEVHSIGTLMDYGSGKIFELVFSLAQQMNSCGYQKKCWDIPIHPCSEPCIYTWQMEALDLPTALSELFVGMQIQYAKRRGMSTFCKKALYIHPSLKIDV